MPTQEVLGNITFVILIALVVFAIWQGLQLLWLHRPAWLFRRRRPSEPIMPAVTSEGRPTTAAARSSNGGSIVPVEGQIVVLNGLLNRDVISLPANQFGIGRFRNESDQVLVALDERSVSRRHAVFHADGVGLYSLTDTHSSYGTFVRKGVAFEALQPGQREPIYNGDEVRFGQHVTVRFELPGDTRSSATQL